MILHRLAQYVAQIRSRGIPSDVAHAATRCIIDWMAATVPGGLQPPATLLASALAGEIGSGAAVLIPSGKCGTARVAALINGCAAHTIEFDDIYRDALYHPGAPTIAAALAIAQERHVTGDLLMRSVIAGYELSTRIGVVVQPKHYDFWHTTGTVGTFGAAAAASTALGLDAVPCAHAIATSATLAAGLQQAFRSHSMSKPLHAGHAAETGLLAALAAAQGVTGAVDVLEGPRGFGAAMSDSPDFSRALSDPDAFNILNMTFKNYSACGHTFAAIDAARELRSRHRLTEETVSRIEIATYGKALEVAGRQDPQTAFEAQFSLSYCTAVALTTGSVRLQAFAQRYLGDAAIRALMARTVLTVDPQAEAQYPRQRAATVVIHTREGRELKAHAPTRRGDPDNPLSDEDLGEKFLDLVGPVTGSATARDLLHTLWSLQLCPDVASLPLPAVDPRASTGAE